MKIEYCRCRGDLPLMGCDKGRILPMSKIVQYLVELSILLYCVIIGCVMILYVQYARIFNELAVAGCLMGENVCMYWPVFVGFQTVVYLGCVGFLLYLANVLLASSVKKSLKKTGEQYIVIHGNLHICMAILTIVYCGLLYIEFGLAGA